MSEEQIKTMVEEYIKDFDPMFKKAVRRAYLDGMQAVMEFMRNKLQEL
jgi:hypothetical protein